MGNSTPRLPAPRPFQTAAAERWQDKEGRRLIYKARRVLTWLEEADMPALRAWAQLEILSWRVYQQLMTEGLFRADGEARTLLDSFTRLRKAQLAFEQQLGMTPAARAALRANSKFVPVEVDAAADERARRIYEQYHSMDDVNDESK